MAETVCRLSHYDNKRIETHSGNGVLLGGGHPALARRTYGFLEACLFSRGVTCPEHKFDADLDDARILCSTCSQDYIAKHGMGCAAIPSSRGTHHR
jgi:hypothetical protein